MMFGSSSSYNNIFGGINESHMRLFGGDRALSTKDIEGAQPRKYTKHVWGGYDANQYNSGPSYDPSKSTIKSPILGDNVQPLNRAIPNSSGLIFRDPVQMSQSSRLAKNSGFTQSATFERKQAQTASDFGQGLLPEGQQLIERQRVKNVNPTSQLKEQNIFSYPSYINSGSQYQSKPLINTPMRGDKSMEVAKIREKMERHLEIHNNYSTKILATNRSPDSFVLSQTQQKEQNNGRNLGNVSSDGLQVGGGDNYINQQAFALRSNPIFSQNRNYGPDDVLFTSIKAQQNQNPTSQNLQNQQYLGNNQQQQQQGVQDNNNAQTQVQNSSLPIVQKLGPKLGENQPNSQEIPPQNIIVNENEKKPSIFHLPNPSLNEKNPSGVLRQTKEKNPKSLLNSSLNDELLVQHRYSLKSKQPLDKQTSNIVPTSDPISALYPKPTPRGQQQIFQSQNQEIEQQQGSEQLVQRNEVRTNLSSRGRMILNQGKLKLTSNGEYGNGTGFLNSNPFINGKILYQSKRDNYLYSNASLRSQSAQANRLQNETTNLKQVNPNEILNPSQSTQNLVPKLIPQFKAQYPDFNKNTNPGMFSRSDKITSPIAGIQNQYAEINAKEVSDKRKELYEHQQASQDGTNGIKFFGAKALKNLSNVNIY